MMHKIKTGEIILEKVNKKLFKYYSDLFLKSKRDLKPNSLKEYSRYIGFWNSFFADRDIKEIKASEIKEAIFTKDIKVQGMKDHLVICKGIFNEAFIDDEINSNPVDKISLPKAKKKEILPFTKEEVKAILDNANGFFKAYLAVAFYTGIRTGELLALKWQNIDFKNKRIYINATVGNYKEQTTKTGTSTRYVPLFDILEPYLREQQKRTGLNKNVFCTKNGRHYSSSNLTIYEWRPLLRRIKIPERRMYETRHTFATNMIESQQFSLNQIAAWLGHANIQTLINRYNKFIPSEIAKFDGQFDVFKGENDTENVTQNITSA
eukprot:TRINITY_DN36435_c0_g1_i4.p1 TRINITY_DN36435_c0_g1~~TRINITY_DN36435_c0_g1_i4.p1  ORF type:complete len:321 (+),score=-24.98 TRINITY_DN36435_c0_g1_i4:377-1339(+)